MTRSRLSRRPMHHSLMAILFPPLAHWHHRRYAGKMHHLILDSGLNVVMLGLALWVGIGLWFALQISGIGIRVATTTVRNNEPTSFQLTVQNQNRHPLDGTHVNIQVPKNWSLQTPSDELLLGQINGLSQKTLDLIIVPHTTTQPRGSIKILIQGQRGSVSVSQSASLVMAVSTMPVSLTAAKVTGNLGHPTTATITLTSTSDATLDDIALEPKFSSAVQYISAQPVLTEHRWNLTHLAPHSTKTFTLLIRPSKAGILQLPIRLGVLQSGRFLLDHQQNIPLTISSAASGAELITTSPQSGANVAAEAVYYTSVGFQFGYGTFPPRVGQTTGFRIFWYIRPSTSSATAATMSAVLPSGSTWQGNSSVTAGSGISYDASSRRVRWAVGAWSANQDTLTGSFDVTLTPIATQIGLYPTLIGAASLSYLDAAGRLQIVRTGPATTSTADPKNRTAGRVQK